MDEANDRECLAVISSIQLFIFISLCNLYFSECKRESNNLMVLVNINRESVNWNQDINTPSVPIKLSYVHLWDILIKLSYFLFLQKNNVSNRSYFILLSILFSLYLSYCIPLSYLSTQFLNFHA